MSGPLLEVTDLDVTYPVKGWRRPDFRALESVSLSISPGETVGLVGESGSGKTTLGRAILGLAPVAAGSIRFEGREIAQLKPAQRRALSTDIQVVFQDPYSSLNPAMTVSEILAEPLSAGGSTRADAQRRVRELLEQVGLPTDSARRMPREFSGGQRQRIAIARALALGPKLIVCDEAVSALDLTTQAKVLDLLIELQEETGVAYLFISHDLSVVRHISHRVSVMLRGRIVETGDADTVTSTPTEPYTRRLLLASPVADPARQAERRAHYDSLPPITLDK
ncbi:ATP-binding cassette domain-containing protein [Microbacterium sp. P06]|uniref:ATP-binding cassette domain-containing protein n=1 Tax=unclassified Microbacterium TaxID=2609290 RepID=UPI003746E87B